MTSRAALVPQRLRNQQLVAATCRTPSEIVAWFGAVQAQDQVGARWAIGLRVDGATDPLVARAADDGELLRTHVLRPTWHFVTAADIRWMVALTAPRIRRGSAYYLRTAGFDARLLARSATIFERVLGGGAHLTRAELGSALARAGIAARGNDLAHLLMHAELDALICSGAQRGKQSTYALLDERVPPVRPLDREAALAALAHRYFQSHGPATVADYVWWSGLTVADARAGIALARGTVVRETIDGADYWLVPPPAPGRAEPSAHLLPNYDEFLVAYKDRSAAIEPQAAVVAPSGSEIFTHVVVLNGRVAGTWVRAARKHTLVIEARLRRPLTTAEHRRLQSAVVRLGLFLETPVELTITGL